MAQSSNNSSIQSLSRRIWGRIGRRLWRDSGGAVLIEAAFALSVLAILLLGIVTYGLWLTAAASLQQIANEAARATLAGMDDAEREEIASRIITHSLRNRGVIEADKVETAMLADDGFYTVTLSYDANAQPLFANSIVPLPQDTIVRSASVEMSGW